MANVAPLRRALPRRGEGPALVVALGLSVGPLMLDAEVSAARLLPIERVDAHELGHVDIVDEAPRALELLVETVGPTDDTKVGADLFAELTDCLLYTSRCV